MPSSAAHRRLIFSVLGLDELAGMLQWEEEGSQLSDFVQHSPASSPLAEAPAVDEVVDVVYPYSNSAHCV